MKPTLLTLAIATALTSTAPALAGETELLQRMEKLSAELESLKAEMAKMKSERGVASPETAAGSAAGAALAGIASQTTVTGYGEINYNRPRRDGSQTQADLRRAVLGIGHRFNDKTELGFEVEFEHAVTSADDSGEVAVEQLWIDHRFTDNLTLRSGLFLVPMGLLNERHEPPTFYGVERNFVETAIISTTWREGGLMLMGSSSDQAWGWNVGLSTGFDLTKWDATGSEGSESPLGSIHQELALAKARNLSVLGSLNYRGVPGLTIGGAFFTGQASHKTADFAAPNARVTLWDVHARWAPGPWDLSALYARGTISDTKALNLTLVGNPTLIPEAFWGWYGQVAYKAWRSGDYALSPFVRYERFNTAAKFADLGPGLTPDNGPTERVVTVGANFNVHPNVVFKADYQKFHEDSSRDRFNLGIGFMF